MTRLFIAEKPSLGKAIAAQLPGAKKPSRTHIVCGSDTVTWAFGHLYELAEPDHYLSPDVPKNGSGKKKWRLICIDLSTSSVVFLLSFSPPWVRKSLSQGTSGC